MLIAIAACASAGACGASSEGSTDPTDAAVDAATADAATDAATDAAASSGRRGFPEAGPWVSFYGPAAAADIPRIAATFRIINIDADPKAQNVTEGQITTLRATGKNRVISYLNLGACETYRDYYAAAPPGFASCTSSGALTTVYSNEYPDEKWANLSNVAYRKLMVEHVAKRLWDRGIDGFFLDNLEVVEHGASAAIGPCDDACAQGGLDLVWELRQRFPGALIVMQNATSDVTRKGVTHGAPYSAVLDGISHEEVYGPGAAAQARDEMLAWRSLALKVDQRPFWLAAEDYVGACAADKKADQAAIAARAQADGLSSYVTDASGAQKAPCFWDGFK